MNYTITEILAAFRLALLTRDEAIAAIRNLVGSA